MLSTVEFHPLCITKAQTAGCANTSSCGAHSTIRPLSSISSSSPSGSSPDLKPRTRLGLTTQMNGRLLLARPQASSTNSWVSTAARLPKLM
uniref:Bx9 n=1 Tax=Arundo donax TaxID=35708 RepID=A0A0A9G6U5_ARUDO